MRVDANPTGGDGQESGDVALDAVRFGILRPAQHQIAARIDDPDVVL